MKRIQCLALLGAAFIAGCSERQPTTAPVGDAAALVTASSTSDRPYQWNFSCKGSGNFGGPIYATWFWTENGIAMAGTEQQAYCSTSIQSSKVSGSALRPANANGMSACVGEGDCSPFQAWPSWTFDLTGPFKATLDGSVIYFACDLFNRGGKCGYVTVKGTLTVDS